MTQQFFYFIELGPGQEQHVTITGKSVVEALSVLAGYKYKCGPLQSLVQLHNMARLKLHSLHLNMKGSLTSEGIY